MDRRRTWSTPWSLFTPVEPGSVITVYQREQPDPLLCDLETHHAPKSIAPPQRHRSHGGQWWGPGRLKERGERPPSIQVAPKGQVCEDSPGTEGQDRAVLHLEGVTESSSAARRGSDAPWRPRAVLQCDV